MLNTLAIEAKVSRLGDSPSGVSVLGNIANIAALQEIIATFLDSGSVAKLSDGSEFVFSTTSAATVDGFNVVTPTTPGTGRWIRVVSDSINAVVFGMVPNDNTAQDINKTALLALFAFAAARTQTTILIPDGDFYLKPSFTGTVLNVPSGTTIIHGKYTRIIVDLAGDLERWTVYRLNAVNNVKIVGGVIVGDKITVLSGGNYGYGITINNDCRNVVIEDVTILDCYTDAMLVAATARVDLRCNNLRTIGNRRAGVSITSGTHMQFVGCLFAETDGLVASETGVNIESEAATDVQHVTFRDCEFTDNGTIGLYIHQGFGAGYPRNIDVLSCLFDGNTTLAINIVEAFAINVLNCVFVNGSTDESCNFADGTDFAFIGNNILGGGKGVFIQRSQRCRVLNNSFKDTLDSAIITSTDTTFANTVDACDISHNLIINSAEHAIDFRGTNSRLSYNRIDRCQKDGIRFGNFNNFIGHNQVFSPGLAANATWRGIADGGNNHVIVGNMVRFSKTSQRDTAAAGGASTITLSGRASLLNDYYNGFNVVITSGTGAGQTGLITGYVGATQVATISAPWGTPPDATSVYEIRPVQNLAAYGCRLFSGNTFCHDNDFSLSGITANFNDAGVGNDLANNRTT